jgi:transposase-like protein
MMHEQHDASHAQPGVSVAEAARLLGIAPSTVRRQIRLGQLEALREIRPQGSAWRVILPGGTTDCVSDHRPRAGAATADGASHAPPQEEGRTAPGAAPGATARPATREHAPLDIVAVTALVEALAAARTLADQRAETIAEMAERLGYVTAERDMARSELERLLATAPEAPTAPILADTSTAVLAPVRALWSRLWPVLGLLGAVVVLLLFRMT